MKKFTWMMVLVAGLLFLPAARADEDLTQLVKQLQKQVEDQNARIKDLEARQGTNPDVDKLLAKMKTEENPHDFHVFWKDGLRLETADGNYKMAIGGRFFYDFGWIRDHGGLKSILGKDPTDGAEARNARIYTAGTINKNIEYNIEYDFSGNDGRASLKDTYIKIKGMDLPPVQYIQIGHFFEAFSLGTMESSKYTVFMEPASPAALAPGRNAGVQIGGTQGKDRMTWALGGFRNTDNEGDNDSDTGYHVTTRVTGLPYYAQEGKQLVHLGAAYSYQTPDDPETVQYRARPEFNNTEYFVNTGAYGAEQINLVGFESAMVYHSFHSEAEYIMAYTDGGNGMQNTKMSGVYGQAGYFLTGETRPYDKKSGLFGRVKPKSNFGDGGMGAWEVKARYSYLDLQETDVQGGRMTNLSGGLNWYLNPNVRLMWDYIHSFVDRDNADDTDHGGQADIVMMRTQIDF